MCEDIGVAHECNKYAALYEIAEIITTTESVIEPNHRKRGGRIEEIQPNHYYNDEGFEW